MKYQKQIKLNNTITNSVQFNEIQFINQSNRSQYPNHTVFLAAFQLSKKYEQWCVLDYYTSFNAKYACSTTLFQLQGKMRRERERERASVVRELMRRLRKEH